MRFGTDDLHMTLIDNQPGATQNFNFFKVAPQDVRPEMSFFPYNSKCIDFKPHEYIEGEYEVGHCGHSGTTYMSVSITVLEIQHIGIRLILHFSIFGYTFVFPLLLEMH